MNKFYRYHRYFEKDAATVSCLFIAAEEMVDGSIGMKVSFGYRINGSDAPVVEGILNKEDITILSENQSVIRRLLLAFPQGNNDGTIEGHNPLKNLWDEDDYSIDAYLGWTARGE